MNGFIFDENLPARILFLPRLPVINASTLGPVGSKITDSMVWDHAKSHSLVIVTKDADFSNRIMVSQSPPWVVRFRIGNLRRAQLHLFAAKVWPRIEQLLPAHKLINVYLDRIEAIRT